MIDYDNTFHTMDMDCDGANCRTHQQFDEGSWGAAIQAAKEYGWIIKSDNGRDFYHFCSEECADS